MKKFFLMTRGRTGSTAVIDELNKIDKACVLHELFTRYDDQKDEPEWVKSNPLLSPLDQWKKSCWWSKKWGFGEKQLASLSLNKAISVSRKLGKNVFGFKVLSHHFIDRPYLLDTLRTRNFKAIYLKRNLARQCVVRYGSKYSR